MNSLPWLACSSSQSPAATFSSRASPTSKEAGGTAGDKIHFQSIGTAHAQTVFDCGDDFDGLAPFKLAGLADEAQALAGFKLAGVFLLGFRPRERIKDADGFILLDR